jgi:hypothetical protein
MTAVACQSATAPAAAPFPTPGGPVGDAARVYPLLRGWHDGQIVQYYDLGTNTPLDPDDPTRVRAEPVWMFVSGFDAEGKPVQLEGQDNLFDVTVGDANYSDLWQLFTVTPTPGYAPNSITSYDALVVSGLPIEQQRMLVNCPIVPPGSSLADESKELKKGWVKGQPVVYFDFGATSATPGKLFVFVTGFNEQGEPLLVPDQHFVFSVTRGGLGYSDFWRVAWVTVDSNYRADSIRSAADIDPARVTDSTIIVNYPHQ